MEQLVNDAEKYTLVNHVLWGLWGLISGYVNEIDFDYTEYARQRFQQYRLSKSRILCLGDNNFSMTTETDKSTCILD